SLGGSATATGAGSIGFVEPLPTAPSAFQPQQYGAPARSRAHAWLLSEKKPPTLTVEKLTPAGAAICCGVVKTPPGDPLPSWPAMLSPQHTVVPLVPIPQLNMPPALTDADASTP